MIKIILIKPHHVKLPPVMLAMAVKTIFTGHLPIGVITSLFLLEGLDFLMAIQTFLVRDFISQIMAKGTISDSFQLRVRLRQRPGGKLSETQGDGKKGKQNGICQDSIQGVFICVFS